MNMIKLILNERRCAYLPPNKGIAANKWSELEWKQEHTQPELFLKHSVRTNSIRILRAFVHRMRWLFQIKDKSLVLGTHLVETYPNYTRPASELSNNSSYHLDGEWLYLSAFNDWRFVKLNTVFSRNCQPLPETVVCVFEFDQKCDVGRFGHADSWRSLLCPKWITNLLLWTQDGQSIITLHFKQVPTTKQTL